MAKPVILDMKLNLIARRSGSDFVLFSNGKEFGRLVDCEVVHVYQGFMADDINQNMEGDFSIRERLVHIRKVIESEIKRKPGCYNAEQYAAYAMERRTIGEKLNISGMIKDGQGMLDQACAAIRTRTANSTY